MGLQTYTRSMLSIDPKHQRADTHTLSHTSILFSVDFAKAEAQHVALLFWFLTGAFYSVTGLKPSEPGVPTCK